MYMQKDKKDEHKKTIPLLYPNQRRDMNDFLELF